MREVIMSEVRPEAAHLAVVITDGQSQQWVETYAQAKQARDQGIEMFAIGVGKVGGSGGISMEELNEIAGREDHVFIAHDYSALHQLQATLAYRTCKSGEACNGRAGFVGEDWCGCVGLCQLRSLGAQRLI